MKAHGRRRKPGGSAHHTGLNRVSKIIKGGEKSNRKGPREKKDLDYIPGKSKHLD